MGQQSNSDYYEMTCFFSFGLYEIIRIIILFERYITNRKLMRKKVWPKDVKRLEKGPKKKVYKYIALCQRRATVLYSHSWIQNQMMIFLSMTWIGFSKAVNSFSMIMYYLCISFIVRFFFNSFIFYASIRHFSK